MTTQATLCFIMSGGRTLLLRKAEGFRGGGKWNAPGGKLLPGETAQECAIREVAEETGLTVQDMKEQGVLRFFVGGEPQPEWVVTVFRAGPFSGSPAPSAEGKLQWHDIRELPYSEMWEVDHLWLPAFLSGKVFRGDFYFDEEGERLTQHRIELLD
ncbi:MAG: 8-oxo-dGTP diphosphatase [Thermoplasmata archaeon]